jgi:hypothetical protein
LAASVATLATAGLSPWASASGSEEEDEATGGSRRAGRNGRRRACWGVLLRRRHGWLTEEEVVPDADMRGKGEPEIRGGHSGGEVLSGGSECPAAREVGGGADGNWEE